MIFQQFRVKRRQRKGETGESSRLTKGRKGLRGWIDEVPSEWLRILRDLKARGGRQCSRAKKEVGGGKRRKGGKDRTFWANRPTDNSVRPRGAPITGRL